jgi:hypothetical protein
MIIHDAVYNNKATNVWKWTNFLPGNSDGARHPGMRRRTQANRGDQPVDPGRPDLPMSKHIGRAAS